LDRFSVYYAGFSAAHKGGISHTRGVVETRDHGHDWRIVVEAKGDERREIQQSLEALTGELHGRSLEAMMPGAATTASGVASWLYERLATTYPELTRVEAECAGHHAYVVSEARRG
jgi:6-pyruvoyl-tetrahydropterin synthase